MARGSGVKDKVSASVLGIDVMKSSGREVSRAGKRRVGWERESQLDAWCRDGNVDNDEQRRLW